MIKYGMIVAGFLRCVNERSTPLDIRPNVRKRTDKLNG